MALIEYQLDRKINKVENAIKTIQLANLSNEPLYVKAFDRMLENMPDKKGISWGNGQDVFDWWLYGKQEVDENQFSIDDIE